MAAPEERMKAMRDRRRERGFRELRLVVPDPRSQSVRRRIAAQVAGLVRRDESDALMWINAVSEFDDSVVRKVMMGRGDVVTVAAAGVYGKPRPAVIVQTVALPETHALVIICLMTSELTDAPDFRITADPNEANGLQVRSQIMSDKPVTVGRHRIGKTIGPLEVRAMGRLSVALAFVMGLAD
jgi:mRNA interferase MazF